MKLMWPSEAFISANASVYYSSVKSSVIPITVIICSETALNQYKEKVLKYQTLPLFTFCERSMPNFKQFLEFSSVSSGRYSHSSSSSICPEINYICKPNLSIFLSNSFLPITGCLLAIAYSLPHSSVSSNLQSSLHIRCRGSLFLTSLKDFRSFSVSLLYLFKYCSWYLLDCCGSMHKGNAEKHKLGKAYLLQLEDISLK